MTKDLEYGYDPMNPDSQLLTLDAQNMFRAHWQPLLNMISLVEPLHLRKAMRNWVIKNQNCAYSMKTGACSMDCTNCANDITIEHILILTKTDQKKDVTKGESK